MRSAAAPALLLLPLACAVLPAGAADLEQTPRALVLQLQALEEQERYGEILQNVTPDQREAYLFISWYGAAFDALGSDPEASTDYRAIVSTHGLDEAWLSQDASGSDGLRRLASKALRGVDLAALLDDLATFRREHGRFGTAFGFAGEVRDLHVEENWALARVGDIDLELLRADEAWTWCPFPDPDNARAARP